MRVFVTGASGFVGSAVVENLLGAGHRVVGFARNEVAADAVARLGAEVHKGDLSDLESVAAGARACDGVIHTAFVHDFTQFAVSAETDRRAIVTFGDALAGTGKPLVVTSAIGLLPAGRPTNEDDAGDPNTPGSIRMPAEKAALACASKGVRATLVRLPPVVHDRTKQGLASMLVALAKQTGVSAYVGDGLNRWPGVHVLDAAQLFRLALEQGVAGSRYHAIAEDCVQARKIAETIGNLVGVPVVSKNAKEAVAHFNWLAYFVGADFQVSSTQTKQALGWRPTHPGMLSDLEPER